MNPCGVCHGPASAMNRVGGLAVCDHCLHGGVGDAVAARGWTLTTETWVRVHNNNRTYYAKVVGTVPDARLTATFQRRTAFQRWFPIFGGHRTGDKLFDRAVHATGDVSGFLSSEGAQSSVMDLVGEGAIVQLRPGVVEALAARSGPIDTAQLEAETAVLMAHVATHAALGA